MLRDSSGLEAEKQASVIDELDGAGDSRLDSRERDDHSGSLAGPRANARILVVDDDPFVREVFSILLDNDGHVVEAVSEGEAALERAKEQSFDIAIVDLFMPIKEGLETIRDLRRDHPDTRVIAVSGGGFHQDTDFLTLATKLGADIALHKPVRAKVLRGAIVNCLGQPPAVAFAGT